MAPAVLAIVLGPLAEQALRQSLLASQGQMGIFFTRPLSLIILIGAFALMAVPIVRILMRRGQSAECPA